MEVDDWGYHLDQHARIDVGAAMEAVHNAMPCGLADDIFDVEATGEEEDTPSQLAHLLDGLRHMMGGTPLGDTTFGHPGWHPHVPWQWLDSKTDLVFPQISFEKCRRGCLYASPRGGLTRQ